jgi:hypothetical protein
MIYLLKRQRELRDPQGSLDPGPSIRMCGYSSCVVREACKKNTTRVCRKSDLVFPHSPRTPNVKKQKQNAPSCLGQLRLRALDDRVEGLLRREDGVKIGHVYGATHVRLEQRLDLLREPTPVDLLEERVAHNLIRAIHAQTLRGVARQ